MSISLYIYLIHGIIISLFHDVFNIANDIIYIFIVYAVTIIISVAFKLILLPTIRKLKAYSN